MRWRAIKFSLENKIPSIHPNSYIAHGAYIIGDVEIAENCTVWFNTVLRGDNDRIQVGMGTNIQDGVIIHSDSGFPTVIHGNVIVGHNAIIHGCTIMEGTLIGMGSVILNGAVVGSGSIVAAGSLIKERQIVESGVLVAGSPAKVIRKLKEQDYENMKNGVQHYIEKGQKFKSTLEQID